MDEFLDVVPLADGDEDSGLDEVDYGSVSGGVGIADGDAAEVTEGEDAEAEDEPGAATVDDEDEWPVGAEWHTVVTVVDAEERLTPSILSPFEMTEITSTRATEIARFGTCMVDVAGLRDPMLMAQRELMMRMCPLTLHRQVNEEIDPITSKKQVFYELWDPNEMEFSVAYSAAM